MGSRWIQKVVMSMTERADIVTTQFGTEQDRDLRRRAVKRLEDRRGLMAHVLAYSTVNLLLVALWYATGAPFFWPMFPIFGWGIGLTLHAWAVFWPEPSPRQIEAEVERLRRLS